nr:MFS transporter [Branchiibius sp. NY16-3462-2]
MPGARSFVVSAAVGRLGNAMFGVAIVAMISGRTGSYGLAGAVSAVGLVVFAITAVIVGRLIDTHGQRTIALPLVAWGVAWSVATVLASVFSWPTWTLFVTYSLSAIVVEIGTMSRARWVHLAPDDQRHSAMALEQVADEISFVIGPALAAALATLLFPESGFILAVVLYATGTVLLMANRRTEPPARAEHVRQPSLAIAQPGIRVLAVCLFLVGVIFGSNEIVTIAVSKQFGHAGLAGIVLGTFALGSAIAALGFGSRTVRMPMRRVLLVSALVLVLMQAPILLARSVGVLAVLMFLAGLAAAPALVTSMNLTQQLIPVHQINEALSVVLTAMLVGVAAGSAVGGVVADHVAGAHAYLVPLVAGGLLALTAALGQRILAHPREGVASEYIETV